VPFTVAISPAGIARPERTAKVAVQARDAGGSAVADLRFGLVNLETGLGPTNTTNEDEDEILDVAPGTYRVFPNHATGAHTFDPMEVTVKAGETASIVLAARPTPQLRILGNLPPGTDLVLATGRETERGPDASWSPHLAAEGPATLRVEAKGRPELFFAVGPAKDGFREVAVSVPPKPPERQEPATRQVRVRAIDRDGEEFDDREVEPGTMVVVKREGWRTLRAVAPDRDMEMRWGSGALKLKLRTPDGEAADALVLVDGEVYEAPEGDLEIAGLEPGPHRVVAALRDEVEGGRELRIVLADGEIRERAVVLGEE
jgi:hypothetical protein